MSCLWQVELNSRNGIPSFKTLVPIRLVRSYRQRFENIQVFDDDFVRARTARCALRVKSAEKLSVKGQITLLEDDTGFYLDHLSLFFG